MAKEDFVRTLETYFVKRDDQERFWWYNNPANLLQNGDFETWTAGSAVGDEPDGWTESGVGDVQREAGTVKRCTYSAELTHPGGAGGSTLYQAASCSSFYRGLYVSLSAWVYADDADRVRLSIIDGVTTTYTDFHPGDGSWVLLTMTKLIAAANNQVTVAFRIEVGAGAVTAWVDAVHLCFSQVPRGFTYRAMEDDGTITIEGGVITKNVQEGDPKQCYQIGGVPKAVTGVDDDDGDKFKIAIGTCTLGTAADVIIIDTSGNVGIGITAPDGTLHVHTATAGGVTASISARNLVVEDDDDAGISILVPDNAYSQIYFGSPSDNIGALVRWSHDDDLMTIGPSNAGGELQLRVAVGADAVRIDSSGNVGIGTTGPERKLHVLSAAFDDGITVESSEGGTGFGPRLRLWRNSASPANNDLIGLVQFDGEDSLGNREDYAAIGARILNVTNGAEAARLLFYTSDAGTNTLRMVINNDGNVGVGITVPTAKLHVDQASTIAAIPVLLLDQADLSEEFIELTTTVGAGNPIDTAAIGTYYGKMRVMVTGVGFKYIALYNS